MAVFDLMVRDGAVCDGTACDVAVCDGMVCDVAVCDVVDCVIVSPDMAVLPRGAGCSRRSALASENRSRIAGSPFRPVDNSTGVTVFAGQRSTVGVFFSGWRASTPRCSPTRFTSRVIS
ncbi:hypothetical protein SAV31267_080990 [Streptomyces avermitilis]|uniref:Uncharacterized protein n=1 Tax=Streptomyces avermitilis TaxID=33903 RepID=A0A4D4N3P9_STRAX|nr:hypothetical protein SAV31267_080990 [Streptomyces avermitilis]